MDSNCTNTSKLWANLKKGNKKALSDLYVMYVDSLYRFGKLYSSDSDLIEDGIHDLFVELYERRKKLPVARNVKNYLFTILKRKIMELSRNSPSILPPQDDYDGKIYRDQELSRETEIINYEEKEELGLLLSKAINKLTPKQREGVFMRFYENRSYEEVALNLDVSIETARTLVYRSLKSMRENFS